MAQTFGRAGISAPQFRQLSASVLTNERIGIGIASMAIIFLFVVLMFGR